MIKFPVCVIIYLTDYCNLNCKHCFLTQTDQLNKNMLDTIKLKEILLELKSNNVFMVAFTGGDPMLHQDIFEILNYTRSLGMLPLLGVSGINIKRNTASKIYYSGVRCVQIGLNGSNEIINDYYRGNNSFKKVITSIRNLQKFDINVNLSFCLDKKNMADLKNMLNLAMSLNIYKVKIEFWNCMSNLIKKNELSTKDKSKVRKICDNFMKQNHKEDWIQYPKASTKLVNIHSNALVIMADGDVKKNEMGETLGNIYSSNIMNILKGDRDEK